MLAAPPQEREGGAEIYSRQHRPSVDVPTGQHHTRDVGGGRNQSMYRDVRYPVLLVEEAEAVRAASPRHQQRPHETESTAAQCRY